MKHVQRSFGRRSADITQEQHQARQVATWCGNAGLFFAAIAAIAALADKPGAYLVAFVGAICAIMVAHAAWSEA